MGNFSGTEGARLKQVEMWGWSNSRTQEVLRTFIQVEKTAVKQWLKGYRDNFELISLLYRERKDQSWVLFNFMKSNCQTNGASQVSQTLLEHMLLGCDRYLAMTQKCLHKAMWDYILLSIAYALSNSDLKACTAGRMAQNYGSYISFCGNWEPVFD